MVHGRKLRALGRLGLRFAMTCYSFSRINYDVACPMNFRKYPYDVQMCKVKYESCK